MKSILKKNWIWILLGFILMVIFIVMLNWDSISETETVKMKLKILESMQKNELDSVGQILQDYMDSIQ